MTKITDWARKTVDAVSVAEVGSELEYDIFLAAGESLIRQCAEIALRQAYLETPLDEMVHEAILREFWITEEK